MTHKIITLGDVPENSPSIAAEVDPHDERWNGYLIPLLTFEQFLGHWKALEDNDRGNGEWKPYPRLSEDGLVLTVETTGADPAEYLAESDGRFRLDGLVWIEGDPANLPVLIPYTPTSPGARIARDVELGRRLLAIHGDEGCEAGYTTTVPEYVGRYGRGYGDIEQDGTTT